MTQMNSTNNMADERGMRSGKALGLLAGLSMLAAVSGCAGLSGSAAAAGGGVEEGVVHQTTPEERAFLKRTEPLTADRIVLHVNGMGCPLCVTNVDRQLLRLKGVEGVQVDLGAGTVAVALTGSDRPSPARLEHAVADAGNTLAKIEIVK